MGSSLSVHGKGKIWTLEKTKEGFEKFYEEFERYPMANEVDDFDYLPSSRQIQRNFGGLVSLRRSLGLSIENYGEGASRSKIATHVNERGVAFEIEVRDYLQEKFNDPFVHIERPVHMNSKDRFDFYVYAKPMNFAIDVFGTTDIRCLIKVMNMKEARYRKVNILKENEKLYFIYFSDFDLKNRIGEWMNRKKVKFSNNWMLLTFDEFKKEMLNYVNYNIS